VSEAQTLGTPAPSNVLGTLTEFDGRSIRVAVHELGHAVLATRYGRPVGEVILNPLAIDGGISGSTELTPGRRRLFRYDRKLGGYSPDAALRREAWIDALILLAGRTAEDLFFGGHFKDSDAHDLEDAVPKLMVARPAVNLPTSEKECVLKAGRDLFSTKCLETIIVMMPTLLREARVSGAAIRRCYRARSRKIDGVDAFLDHCRLIGKRDLDSNRVGGEK